MPVPRKALHLYGTSGFSQNLEINFKETTGHINKPMSDPGPVYDE